MEQRMESVGIGGIVFVCCMVAALAVLNWMFAVYITPVFAHSAGAGIPPLILYALNWLLVPLVTVAAFYVLYKVYASGRGRGAEPAASYRVWALGLVTGSVALLAVQLFIALACVAIWIPGPSAG